MTNRRMIIDTSDAGWSALETELNNLMPNGGQISIQVCDYNANYSLVKAFFSEGNRPTALQTQGEGLFIMDFADYADAHRRMHNQIGEANPQTGQVVTDYYLRSEYEQSTPGGAVTQKTYGGNGRNFKDAVTWPEYIALVGKPTTNRDIYVLGHHFHVAGAGFSLSTSGKTLVMDQGTSQQAPNRMFFDYPGHKGSYYGGPLITDYGVWTDEAVAGANVWSLLLNFDTTGPSASPKQLFYRDFDPTDPQGFGKVLNFKDTQAEMEGERDSLWMASYSPGNRLYVNLPDGMTPDNRIFPAVAHVYMNAIEPAAGTNASFCEFYEERARMIPRRAASGGDNGGNFYDGVRYLRGRNNDVGCDRSGGMYMMYVDANNLPKDIKGPYVEGRTFRNAVLGWFHNRGNPADGSKMEGTHFIDCVSTDLGGVIAALASADGHADAWQGVQDDVTYEGEYRAIRCGGPFNAYVFDGNNPEQSGNYHQTAKNWTFNLTYLELRDHATYFPSVGSDSADVGLHFAGDGTVFPDITGWSINIQAGIITGFRNPIRFKWPSQVNIQVPTQGALVLEPGSYAGGDASLIRCQVASNTIYEVVLSSPTGNWKPLDRLENPTVAGEVGARIFRVVDANTIQYYVTGSGTGVGFTTGQTINNLDDTGTATAFGDGTVPGSGRFGGNPKYNNIDLSSVPAAQVINSSVVGSPVANAADGNVIGFHVQARDNILPTISTGKFVSNPHGTQDTAAWQANVANDNEYDIGSITA